HFAEERRFGDLLADGLDGLERRGLGSQMDAVGIDCQLVDVHARVRRGALRDLPQNLERRDRAHRAEAQLLLLLLELSDLALELLRFVDDRRVRQRRAKYLTDDVAKLFVLR